MHDKKSRMVAIGGVTIAMIILCLYAGTIMKNNKIFFMVLATYIAVLPYAKVDIKTGIISYIASTLLALIIVPNKIYVCVYMFFGIYPYIKHICEKNKNRLLEISLKIIWFNLTCIIVYMIFKSLIYVNEDFQNLWIFVLGFIVSQVLFIIYDIIFTRVITFIQNKIKY